MSTYLEYGQKLKQRVTTLLALEGVGAMPRTYKEFSQLDDWFREQIGLNLPLVLSDNYEHFMAMLPHRDFAGHHVLLRKQIGGFTCVAGFWKWLEFLSHQITESEVDLVADFFSGKHNQYERPFNRDYWMHVVRDYNGYMPIRIECVGEGAVTTGVPFPIAQVYGETPAVWLNEPLYIEIGHLSHVATIAAQFAEILGDPFRFIEVMFRALPAAVLSKDVLLAMLIGGGIISTSNDLGAFINGAPFKSSGTTGHCWYQQWKRLIESLRILLSSPLGTRATVLLDLYQHSHGFKELMQLVNEEGLPAPFAERPDSGDTLKLGVHDLMAFQDKGKNVNVVFEDGKRPADVLEAEKVRRQFALDPNRMFHGAGGSFLGPRSALEAAYKACFFHDGTVLIPRDVLESMKICLDDPMKQSIPGLVRCWFNEKTGFYTVADRTEEVPDSQRDGYSVLYDGLSTPGTPYFNPAYDPQRLVDSPAVQNGILLSRSTRSLLGPSFTMNLEPNKFQIGMTKAVRDKRTAIYQEALSIVGE
jgi:nicotinic acid phosphoribosyltransferase